MVPAVMLSVPFFYCQPGYVCECYDWEGTYWCVPEEDQPPGPTSEDEEPQPVLEKTWVPWAIGIGT